MDMLKVEGQGRDTGDEDMGWMIGVAIVKVSEWCVVVYSESRMVK
jgi:hypothetical protein